MTIRRPTHAAFSLVEVVLAVALCALALAVVLALLPALTRQAADGTDTLAAHRLPDAVEVELRRLVAGDFDGFATVVPVMSATAANGFRLVATRDASRLHSETYRQPATGEIANGERYFLLECWRFPDEPLRYLPEKAFLALHVRVSWPYRLPSRPEPVSETERIEHCFTAAINR